MTQTALEAALETLGWTCTATFPKFGYRVFANPGRVDRLRVESVDPLTADRAHEILTFAAMVNRDGRP